MATTAPVDEIADEELAGELKTAYGDLENVVARIIALHKRLNPEEPAVSALDSVLWHVNHESDRIFATAQNV
jgi:hypothetical protein